LSGPVITVSGPHGTGKSTYAKALAEAFQLRYVSAGELFRDLAREKGVTLEAFSKMAAENPAVDKIIDERTKAEAEKGGVVIDAQLGGWMVKELADVKVLIVAPDDVRFRRIATRDGISVEEARKQTLAREAFQRQRYEKYYGLDVTDVSIYDVKVDTGVYPLEKAKSIVIECVRRQLGRSKLTSS
jgi:cytidylate kinase